MKPRNEAVALVLEQLGRYDKKVGRKHHYGRQELRELMDFIYGGEPQSKDEVLKDNNAPTKF
jgi:hypothetical protein